MQKRNGFTLIELIIVIVILGILAVVAAPKFIDISEDAERATFKGIAAAFKSGVNQVHLAWRIRGKGKAVQDFIPLSMDIAGGDLSVNQFGYPADTRGRSLDVTDTNDCLDVFRAVLSTDAEVESGDSALFQAEYFDAQSCLYTYVSQPSLTFTYDSNSGDIVVNADP
jgi:prepilin-type N-terminal cleavage/methylation domain-containing protein